ncbi:FG-GAP repeat domain-containing protein [Actinoplanes palleronii]|uniref:VCBS repeat-containing protein n=1 Tax=Actinoplanes palleronii TaxID=113570 RepID=A0ABQ4B8E8_9ACTN|nr:VCBS repeat-containing protein [Actinoplanes palleronii]GIE66535.1 hypothetical protein Apa02nite_026430 [Actinoplanes palleronii]
MSACANRPADSLDLSTSADRVAALVREMRQTGKTEAQVTAKLSSDWCINPIGTQGITPFSSGDASVTWNNMSLLYDNVMKTYYGIVNWKWNDHSYGTEESWTGCFDNKIGGWDSVLVRIAGGEFQVVSESATAWGDNALDSSDGNYDTIDIGPPAVANENGVGYTWQDKARNVAYDSGVCNYTPGNYSTLDLNLFNGTIVVGFDLLNGSCTNAKLFPDYVHTWDSTTISNLNITPAGPEITFGSAGHSWSKQTTGPSAQVCDVIPADSGGIGGGGGIPDDEDGEGGGGSPAPTPHVAADLDKDTYSDLALYRKDCSTGSNWWASSGKTGTQLVGGHEYGGCKDLTASGDYDGDGYTDLALYRQDCTNGSVWNIKNLHTGKQLKGTYRYGGCHDIPAPGDYDGDGWTDLALYRPDCTNGSSWWILSSRTGNQIVGGSKYGGCTDIPAPGDYDGDGRTELALYRRDCTNGSLWNIKNVKTGTQVLGSHKYGGCADVPAPGDYDNDGRDDLALYRPDCTNGSVWNIKNIKTGTQIKGTYKYGGCKDIPAPGDYDGDGYTDLALYRRDCSTGSSWWISSSRTGTQIKGGTKYGGCADTPAASNPATTS